VKSHLLILSDDVHVRSRISLAIIVVVVTLSLLATSAHAAITWDGEGGSSWWFDPQNWSEDQGNGGLGHLPPSTEGLFGPVAEDAQINGSDDSADFNSDSIVNGADFLIWQQGNGGAGGLAQGDANDDGLVDGDDLAVWENQFGPSIPGGGVSVVYDPDNDPFFANAGTFPFPTGSPVAGDTVDGDLIGDYGPQHLYRFYVSRNTTNSNLVEIKSGDLVIASTTIIGRSGSDASNQNLGMVIQTGGRVRLPRESLNIGRIEASGWGNGTYEYRAGTLDVAAIGGDGIRLSTGTVSGGGTGGHGRFRMGNPTTGGYVRTFDFETSSDGLDGDGILTGVGISEFIYENGGTRPIQVTNNLVLSNGLDIDAVGIRSSRLELTLEEAPAVDGFGVPNTLGLFQIDGLITGTGDLGNVFSNSDATDLYEEGDVVSALFGSTTYNWTITYTGDITWTNADDSVINTITGPTTGNDIVLVGLSSALSGSMVAVPEPSSLVLLCVAGIALLAAKRSDRQL